MHSSASDAHAQLRSLGVLLDVAFEVDLGTFWKKTLTSFLAATAEAVTTCFSAHAGAKPVLTFASALGRLEGAFHDERRFGRLGLVNGGFDTLIPPMIDGRRMAAYRYQQFC